MKFKKANTKIWVSALIVLAVLIIGFSFLNSNKASASATTGNAINSNKNPASSTSDSKIKFSDTKFAKSSYLISGDSLSPEAQNAISGFNISRDVSSDGTISITLIALNPEYQNQNYILQPGQSLYFIESYASDDSPPNGENPSLMDDHAIIVDKDGYAITQLPSR